VVSQKWQGHTGVFRVGSPVKERKKMVLSREELLAHRGIYRKEHKLETKAYNRVYKQEHRSETKAYNHMYRQGHKSARSAYNRMYRETHRDAYRAYMRDYMRGYGILYRPNHRENQRVSDEKYYGNDEHRQKCLETGRNRRLLFPSLVRAQDSINRHKRRASKAQTGGSHTLAEWEARVIEFNYCCAYCGEPVAKPEKDHVIPISKGGTSNIDNIVPACPHCNRTKHTNIWVVGQTGISSDTVVATTNPGCKEHSKSTLKLSRKAGF